METTAKTAITVETAVTAPIEKVWSYWSKPEHIMKWNSPSDDWHTPYAENDLRTNGKFKSTMAAKDGSFSFDFEGVYTDVQESKGISYTVNDGRKVKVTFSKVGNAVKVVETFEAESINSHEMQKSGWQAILDNFKKYTETN